MTVWIGGLTDALLTTGPWRENHPVSDNLTGLVFLAAAEDASAVTAVLDAVRSVAEVAHRAGPNPDDIAHLSGRQTYVYAYFDNPDDPQWSNCFYVGKGIGQRWTQHVSDRLRTSLTAATDKERRIDHWIATQKSTSAVAQSNNDPVRLAENRLVRIVGQWSGPHAEACAFATEYALIRGFIGPYQLTNLTAGNDSSCGVRLLIRPAVLDLERLSHKEEWDRAVRVFVANPVAGTLRSRIRPTLHLLANLALIEKLDGLLSEIGLTPKDTRREVRTSHSDIPLHCSVEGDSDPCATYAPLDGRPFRVQLKLSRATATAFVNIRPAQDTVAGFAAFGNFIAAVRPNGKALAEHYGGENPVRNPGKPYYKPFAAGGVGRADTRFPLHHGDRIRVNADWALLGEQRLSLFEALQLFLDLFMLDKENGAAKKRSHDTNDASGEAAVGKSAKPVGHMEEDLAGPGEVMTATKRRNDQKERMMNSRIDTDAANARPGYTPSDLALLGKLEEFVTQRLLEPDHECRISRRYTGQPPGCDAVATASYGPLGRSGRVLPRKWVARIYMTDHPRIGFPLEQLRPEAQDKVLIGEHAFTPVESHDFLKNPRHYLRDLPE